MSNIRISIDLVIRSCQQKKFTSGIKSSKSRERIEDEEHPGRPSTSTDETHVQKINCLVFVNHRLTIRDLANDIAILKGSVNTILKEVFRTKCIKSRLVTKTMYFLDKHGRAEVCRTIVFKLQTIRTR